MRAAWCSVALVLAGCAGAPKDGEQTVEAPSASTPGVLQVEYSLSAPQQGTLKEEPTEVTLITPQFVQGATVARAALSILSIVARAPILDTDGYGKENYRGKSLAETNGTALANPYPKEFVERLQGAVSQAIAADEQLRQQSWSKALIVGRGSARLMYEGLTGPEAEQFRLRSELVVYKPAERFAQGVQSVDCSASTEPLALNDWYADGYARVKQEQAAFMQACEAKVLAELPRLLNRAKP